jgi:predicted metal-dependent phosphoesterase TrpH
VTKSKINIHSHSLFSDGLNSPYKMALKAKELDFSALVLTDHFYGDEFPQSNQIGLESLIHLRRCKSEIERDILPVILGVEIPLLGQEVLVFGSEAVNAILRNGLPTKESTDGFLYDLRLTSNCAVILCHPKPINNKNICKLIDGYEHINGGFDFFREIGHGKLQGKQRWCNSDAHRAVDLGVCYNIVNTEIKNELDLIEYIKDGREHNFYIKGVSNE